MRVIKGSLLVTIFTLMFVGRLFAQGAVNIYSADTENGAGGVFKDAREGSRAVPFKTEIIGPNTFCRRDFEGSGDAEDCVTTGDPTSRVIDEPKVDIDSPTFKSAFSGPSDLNSNMYFVNKALIESSTTAGGLYLTTSNLTDPAFAVGTLGASTLGQQGHIGVLNSQSNFYDELRQVPGGTDLDGPAMRRCVNKRVRIGEAESIALEKCAGYKGITSQIPGSGGLNDVYKLSDHPAHLFSQPAQIIGYRGANIPALNQDSLMEFGTLELGEMIFGRKYSISINLLETFGQDRISRSHTAFSEIVGKRFYTSMDVTNHRGEVDLLNLNDFYSKRMSYKDVRVKAPDYWFAKFFDRAYHAINNASYRYCRLQMGEYGVGYKDPGKAASATCETGNFEACPEFDEFEKALMVNGVAPSVDLIGALYREEVDLRKLYDQQDVAHCARFQVGSGALGDFSTLLGKIVSQSEDFSRRERKVFEIALKTGVAKVIEVLMEAAKDVKKLTGNRPNDFARNEALGMISRYVENLQEDYSKIQEAVNEDVMDTVEKDRRRGIAASDSFGGSAGKANGSANSTGGFGENS